MSLAQTMYRSSVKPKLVILQKHAFPAPSGPFLNRPDECCLRISGFRGTLFVRYEVTNSSSDFAYLREYIADCMARFQANVSLICQENREKSTVETKCRRTRLHYLYSKNNSSYSSRKNATENIVIFSFLKTNS